MLFCQAPELIDGSGVHSVAADVYALGMVGTWRVSSILVTDESCLEI